MVQEVTGVIARSKGARVESVTVSVPEPGPGEAVVRIQACGVCHTEGTTGKAGSVTTSHSCSGTRRRGSSRAWGRE